MKLIPNIENAHRLWSVRLAVASAALGALEAALPAWEGVLPDGLFAALSITAAVGAAVARVIRQETLDG